MKTVKMQTWKSEHGMFSCYEVSRTDVEEYLLGMGLVKCGEPFDVVVPN